MNKYPVLLSCRSSTEAQTDRQWRSKTNAQLFKTSDLGMDGRLLWMVVFSKKWTATGKQKEKNSPSVKGNLKSSRASACSS
jgi:hypothetical protein